MIYRIEEAILQKKHCNISLFLLEKSLLGEKGLNKTNTSRERSHLYMFSIKAGESWKLLQSFTREVHLLPLEWHNYILPFKPSSLLTPSQSSSVMEPLF